MNAEKTIEEADPMLNSFLSFLGQNILHSPAVLPLSEQLAGRIDRLTEGVVVSPDEPLGEEIIL